MYLKKIEMQGFKSFADKTIITFEDSVTAIVGPNGSGKSNVSDAIKWVLGEQSAKSLRGGKMEDVIFAGTDKRKQLGYAEVSITFDNKEKLIPIEYSEVEITRRMFRSGESEFYINKNACRLRDIRELIMDTGIGKDGYSIIGQGRIEEILSDKAEDRRGIFEEAAGIVKYKTLKEESQRKLERTENNLVRINDLFVEVEKQNKSLEKDSAKAKEYLDLYNELKSSEITVYINDICKHQENLKNLSKKEENLKANIENIAKEKEALNLELNDIKNKLDTLNVDIEYKRELLNEKIKKIDSIKNLINISKEKTKYESLEKDRIINEIKSLEDKIESDKILYSDIETELKEIENKLVISKDEYIEKETELEKLLKDIKEEEIKLDDVKNKNTSLFNIKIEANSKIASIESFKENLEKRLNKTKEDLDILKLEYEEVNEKNNKYKEEKNIIVSDLELLEKRNNELAEYLSEKENELNILKEAISDIKIELQKSISNYNIYKNMEDAYEGYYKSVKNLLLAIDNKEISDEGFNGVVANLIKVNSGYEIAIETTLGSNLQNVVVTKDTNAKLYIDYLHKHKIGRVTFLPLNKISGNPLNIDNLNREKFGILGLAKDFIEYDKEYNDLINYLLGRTIIVDTVENGIKLSREGNYRIVTLSGDIFNPGGSITGGSYAKNTLSIISRKNKVMELKENIKQLQLDNNNKVEYLETEIEKLNSSKKDMEDLKTTIKNKLDEKALITEKINESSLSLSNNKIQFDRLDNEHDVLIKELEDLNKEKIELKKSLEDNEVSEKDLEKDIDEKTKKYIDLKNNYDLKLEEFTSFKINYNNDINTMNNIKLKKDTLKNQDESSEIRLKELIEKRNQLESNIESISLEVIDAEKNIRIHEDELKSSQQNFDELLLNDKNLKSFREKSDMKLREITDKIYLLEREKDEIDLRFSKENLQLTNVEKNLFVNYELDYEKALKFKLENVEISELRIIVEDLNKSIRKLGNVNIDSINEYQEINERYVFLLEQKTDLENSRDTLLGVINDMDKEMEEKFIKAVKEINTNFTKIFKILFNGGNASLSIENEEDILSSGIDIIAQPPGKKLQNIRLLSGGEKSLTAVALLFAILEMKPSPFCILDEIDAALDDANIGRYTDYLRGLKSETQFILITHRKTTMEIADILYGVTMEEEGVSKLYSLKMEDYMN